MGGERASTTRQREAGKICWKCGGVISATPSWCERLCPKCYQNQPRHRILATYFRRDAWNVGFLEADCVTPVGRSSQFADPERIVALARRGGVTMHEESIKSLEDGIGKGRGSIWLFLTPEQYSKLKRGKV